VKPGAEWTKVPPSRSERLPALPANFEVRWAVLAAASTMTRRSVRRDSACEVVVENGSRRIKVIGVAKPDLGEHLVERNLSTKRRQVLVPDVRPDAGFFEQGAQQVRFLRGRMRGRAFPRDLGSFPSQPIRRL
jgi:hypothetical protein